MALHIIIAMKITGERPDAAASYKIWDFATTIVWCMEATLESWWSYMTTSITGILKTPTVTNWWDILLNSEYSTHLIELGLAAYFVFDSGTVLWKWEIKNQDFQTSLVSVLLNLAGFTYAMIRDMKKIKNEFDDGGTTTATAVISGRNQIDKETYTQIV